MLPDPHCKFGTVWKLSIKAPFVVARQNFASDRNYKIPYGLILFHLISSKFASIFGCSHTLQLLDLYCIVSLTVPHVEVPAGGTP